MANTLYNTRHLANFSELRDLTFPSPHSILLLAANFQSTTSKEIADTAEALISKGNADLCTGRKLSQSGNGLGLRRLAIGIGKRIWISHHHHFARRQKARKLGFYLSV